MRVWTKAVYDIESGQLLESDSYDYVGEVAMAKGASTADAQRQSELQMQTTAFNQQLQQLQQLQSQLSPYTTGAGQGYSPEQMAAMQSQFLNNNAGQFQNAGQAVRQALLARGGGAGDMPVSGDYGRGIASLMGAAASSQAQGLLGLQQANAQQALQNKFNALGLEQGGASILSAPQSIAGSGASSALNAYVQAANSGLMSQFMGGLGRGLGAGLGAGATGGIGQLLGGLGSGTPFFGGMSPTSISGYYGGPTSVATIGQSLPNTIG